MQRREKIAQLEIERQLELDEIYKKYAPKLDELKYNFSLNELLKEGWVKGRNVSFIYGKGTFEFDKRIPNHDFWTRTIRVTIVNDEVIEVITQSGCPQRSICDMEDLKYYFDNNA